MPLRGMIRDNQDEYIGAAGNTNVFYDRSDLRRMALLHTIRDFYELSGAMLGWMNSMGSILNGAPGFNAFNGLTGVSFGVITTGGSLL